MYKETPHHGGITPYSRGNKVNLQSIYHRIQIVAPLYLKMTFISDEAMIRLLHMEVVRYNSYCHGSETRAWFRPRKLPSPKIRKRQQLIL